MHEVPGHDKIDLTHSLVRRRPTFIQYSDQACTVGGTNLLAWCRQNYVLATVQGGLPMLLLKDSPEVHWDLLAAPGASSPKR
jgi:hypothetical protein